MTYLEKLERGEDISAALTAEWGPDTERGRPVRLKIEVELCHKVDKPDYCLSIMGNLTIKECKRFGLRKFSACGQCTEVDDILDENGLVCYGLDELVPIWKKWHLNDTHAGTEAQEACLDRYLSENPGWRYNYDEACQILKKNGLLYDKSYKVDGKPYKYGVRWLFRNIPHAVLVDLCGVLDSGLIIVPKGEKK